MTNGPIANYWPDVPPAAYSILREMAQERQNIAALDRVTGTPSTPELSIVASILCEPHADRATLLRCAILIVLEIERRDAAINV